MKRNSDGRQVTKPEDGQKQLKPRQSDQVGGVRKKQVYGVFQADRVVPADSFLYHDSSYWYLPGINQFLPALVLSLFLSQKPEEAAQVFSAVVG